MQNNRQHGTALHACNPLRNCGINAAQHHGIGRGYRACDFKSQIGQTIAETRQLQIVENNISVILIGRHIACAQNRLHKSLGRLSGRAGVNADAVKETCIDRSAQPIICSRYPYAVLIDNRTVRPNGINPRYLSRANGDRAMHAVGIGCLADSRSAAFAACIAVVLGLD